MSDEHDTVWTPGDGPWYPTFGGDWPSPAPPDSWPGAGTGRWSPPPPAAGTAPGSYRGYGGYAGWAPPGPPRPPARPPLRGLGVAAAVAVVAAFVGVGIGSGLHTRQAIVGPVLSSPTFSTSSEGAARAAAIAAQVAPGVVDITTKLGYQHAAAAGTGMVLTSSGEVLTNNHVIDGATSIAVQVDGAGPVYGAKVVGTDPTHDVAVIQITDGSGFAPVRTGDSSKVALGDPVIAIGNAGGRAGPPSVVTGTIGALDQPVTASDPSAGTSEQLRGLMETDAPLEPGDSGGPLVDTAGRVIGMDTAASGAARFESLANVSFAIPIDQALSIARQIESGRAGGTVHIGSPGFLGVDVSRAGGNGGPPGAVVAGVVPGSPAARAGLSPGDIITSVGNRSVRSGPGLTTAMHNRHPGDKVLVGWTGPSGAHRSATVKLMAGPAD